MGNGFRQTFVASRSTMNDQIIRVDYGFDPFSAIQRALDKIGESTHVYNGPVDGPPETRTVGGGKIILPRAANDQILLPEPLLFDGKKNLEVETEGPRGVSFRMQPNAGHVAMHHTNGWATHIVRGVVLSGFADQGADVKIENRRGLTVLDRCVYDRCEQAVFAEGTVTNVHLIDPKFDHCKNSIVAEGANCDYWNLTNARFVRGRGIDLIYGGSTLNVRGGTMQMHEDDIAADSPNIQLLPNANRCTFDTLQFSHDASAPMGATPAKTRVLFGNTVASNDSSELVALINFKGCFFQSKTPISSSTQVGPVDRAFMANCRVLDSMIKDNFFDWHHSWLFQDNSIGTHNNSQWSNVVSVNQQYTVPGEDGIFSQGSNGWSL